MEDYEKFCEMHRARIRGEPAQSSLSLSAQRDSIPCIRFNGVPVLSPLLTLEKKKELQQDRRKALDLELWRQNSRKQVLLHRVQEILENVQMKKSPNPSDLDQSEMENVHSGLDSMNGFVPQSNGVLSSSPAACGSMEPQKALEVKPADAQVASRRNLLEGNPQFVPPKQKDACRSLAGNGGLLSGSVDRLPSNEAAEQECVEMVSAAEGGPDPYVMSLQNLLKKSREYIQREQTRRSLRVGSKRSVSESHSDKENDAVKMGSSVKERGKPTGRSSITAVAVEKPALTRSSTSPQGASLSKTSTSLAASPSFSKVDIPMRSGTPPVLDSDSDEDLKTTSLFDRDSSILRSLTGSYSKLPSPEPSMSPKMHRRRPRPSSMGHIVINNPVNAYELSPRDKERAADGVTQDVGDKRAASDPVPRLASDFALVSSRKEHAFHKSSSDITDELVVRKLSHGYQGSGGQRETREFPASAIAEGNLISAGPRLPNACLGNPTSQEPPASGYPVVSQNTTSVGAAKQVGLPDKAKPAELNKSYDVESPSPLLLQIQHSPQIDTPGNEQALELGFEKVKRRLELDAESVPKESVPCAVAEGTREPGRHSWLRDQRGPVGSAFAADGTPDRGNYEEEALKQKMLALEELRKRLEAQHVQQLSLLIAEQEMEQERLQKEIAMQERRLKGEEAAAVKTDVPQIALNSGMELGWRKISDAHVLESVRTQAGTVHSAHLESAGFANVTGPGLTADAPFYLWDPPASGKSVSASRSLSRSKMRWSQVYSPEMKRKLDKISALAKGFLTRRLLQTEKLKHLSQTVKDTMEFIKNFQSEAPLKRGAVSAQDANLQERVVAQLRAALYDIHDIFFKMEVSERMNILRHDREVRKEKMLRQLDKAKALRERVTLSTATQKSLDRKKYMKAAEMGMPNKKTIVKQKTPENRVLQPNQGQNAPIQRLLSRQGTPKTSVKGAEQTRKKPSESRVPHKALSGAYAGRIPKKKPNVATI